MRVFALTYGSRGDYQPFIALAKGLSRRGHDVVLGAPATPGVAEFTARHGVSFVPIGEPWRNEEIAEIRKRSPTGDPDKFIRDAMNEVMFQGLEEAYATAREIGRDSDVVVSHFGQFIGSMVAEACDKPFVTAMLDPASVPSRYRPPPGRAPRRIARVLLGRWLNQRLWKKVQSQLDGFLGAGVNTARERVGLPALEHPGTEGLLSPHLNLIAVSPAVVPPAPDWAPRHRFTGYWFLDDPNWQAPPDLVDFVSREPAPIFVALGSIAGAVPPDDAGRLVETVVDGCQKAGVRAVIQPGAIDLGRGDLAPTFLRCEEVEHGWLFERATAAVHHCGAGTAAATLRAGVPSVAVPRAWDQPYWASVLAGLNTAPAPIPRKALTAESLADGIMSVTGDSSYRDRARALRDSIAREDGVSMAVDLIEESVEAQLAARG